MTNEATSVKKQRKRNGGQYLKRVILFIINETHNW